MLAKSRVFTSDIEAVVATSVLQRMRAVDEQHDADGT